MGEYYLLLALLVIIKRAIVVFHRAATTGLQQRLATLLDRPSRQPRQCDERHGRRIAFASFRITIVGGASGDGGIPRLRRVAQSPPRPRLEGRARTTMTTSSTTTQSRRRRRRRRSRKHTVARPHWSIYCSDPPCILVRRIECPRRRLVGSSGRMLPRSRRRHRHHHQARKLHHRARKLQHHQAVDGQCNERRWQ